MPHFCRISAQTILGVIVVSSLVLFPAVPGQTETFPFLAETAADHVNVRAGQNQNFERLCRLDKGEEVIVLEKVFGWYKIQLPDRVPVYVSDKYVGRLDNIYGEILVDRVNARAAAGVQATIVGQLKKGDRVRVLARREGWYTIEPPPQVFGWVAQEFLKFKSTDTAAYQPRPAEESPGDIQAPPVAALGEPRPAPYGAGRADKPVPGAQKTVSVTGYLRANPLAGDSDMSYELVVSDRPASADGLVEAGRGSPKGRPAYYVRGLKPMLDDFVRCMVTVEGTIITEQGSPLARPIINVSRIQLVL